MGSAQCNLHQILPTQDVHTRTAEHEELWFVAEHEERGL